MIRIGVWQFGPRLVPSLVTLVVFPVLLALGFWQLDRAEQKRALHADAMQYRDQPPLQMNRHTGEHLRATDMLWRPVIINGKLDGDNVLLLDNQVFMGEAGYYVFAPVKITGTDTAVLVNRGWISAGKDRRQPPAIDIPPGEITLTGLAKGVPSTGIFLGENAVEPFAEGVYRLQRIRIDEVEKMLDYKLLPYIVRLEPESAHGFVREWPQAGSGEEKHLGYAFQWFALAATLLVIYVVVNCKKAE